MGGGSTEKERIQKRLRYSGGSLAFAFPIPKKPVLYLPSVMFNLFQTQLLLGRIALLHDAIKLAAAARVHVTERGACTVGESILWEKPHPRSRPRGLSTENSERGSKE